MKRIAGLKAINAALTVAAIMFAVTSLVSAQNTSAIDEYVIVADFSGSIFYVGKGFTEPKPVDELGGSTVYGIGMGDFDGDGDFDFVIGDRAGGTLYYFEKTGDGNQFAPKVPLGEYSGFPLDFAVEDFNLDGKLDFIFTNYMGTGYLYLGRGDGTFDMIEVPVPECCLTSDSGDFNGDGCPDFVLQRFSADTGAVYIFFGDGTGLFNMAEMNVQIGSYSWGLTAGDFTGDQRDDLVVAVKNDVSTRFFLYPGFGDGTFGEPTFIYDLGFSDYTPTDNYDFDHDGKMDFIFLAAQAQKGYVFYGLGGGAFAPADVNPISFPTDEPLYALACPPCGAMKVNHPPVAEAGPDIYADADADGFAVVSLNGSGSSDDDGDTLSFKWTVAGVEKNGALADFKLAVGSYVAKLVVSDGEFEAVDEVAITVRDVTPPEIDVLVSPDTLWPANGKMVQVFPDVSAYDEAGDVEVKLVSVVSSDGNESADVKITSDGKIYLRAECDKGNDKDKCKNKGKKAEPRIYTITYEAKDAAGNTAIDSDTVMVPTGEREIPDFHKDKKDKKDKKNKGKHHRDKNYNWKHNCKDRDNNRR
jgi:hypothetical protein